MTIQTTITPEGLADVIQDSDVLINLSTATLPCSATHVQSSTDGRLNLSTGKPTTIASRLSPDAIRQLVTENTRRFVVISDGSQLNANVAEELAVAGIETVSFVLAEDCAADSFMDEEDSEAVAERLRQLGYI